MAVNGRVIFLFSFYYSMYMTTQTTRAINHICVMFKFFVHRTSLTDPVWDVHKKRHPLKLVNIQNLRHRAGVQESITSFPLHHFTKQQTNLFARFTPYIHRLITINPHKVFVFVPDSIICSFIIIDLLHPHDMTPIS